MSLQNSNTASSRSDPCEEQRQGELPQRNACSLCSPAVSHSTRTELRGPPGHCHSQAGCQASGVEMLSPSTTGKLNKVGERQAAPAHAFQVIHTQKETSPPAGRSFPAPAGTACSATEETGRRAPLAPWAEPLLFPFQWCNIAQGNGITPFPGKKWHCSLEEQNDVQKRSQGACKGNRWHHRR